MSGNAGTAFLVAVPINCSVRVFSWVRMCVYWERGYGGWSLFVPMCFMPFSVYSVMHFLTASAISSQDVRDGLPVWKAGSFCCLISSTTSGEIMGCSLTSWAHLGLCLLPARTIDLQALLPAHSLSKFAQRSRNSRRNRDRLAETRFPPHLFHSWCVLGWFTHPSEWAVKKPIGVLRGDSHQWSWRTHNFRQDWTAHTEMEGLAVNPDMPSLKYLHA